MFLFYCTVLITALHRACLEMVTDEACSTLQSSLAKDLEGGIHLGIGGFNLVSSTRGHLTASC